MKHYAEKITEWAGRNHPRYEQDNVLLDAWAEARERTDQAWAFPEAIEDVVKSPIELAFAAAFDLVVAGADQAVTRWNNGALFHPSEWQISADLWEQFLVTPQAKIGRYRADFFIEYRLTEKMDWFSRPPKTDVKVVVECDGHDFHERTKRQAAHDRKRDRVMQEMGYLVYRFTGAEIYADPFRCVQQTLAAFGSHWESHWEKIKEAA